MSVISCKISTVSLTQVPFHITITQGFSFEIIFFNLETVSNFLCKNILSNKTGSQSSFNIAILQPALNHGSIAKIFFPYSGFVIKRLAKFCLKVSIASSSQISLKIPLSSFSTDLNNVS